MKRTLLIIGIVLLLGSTTGIAQQADVATLKSATAASGIGVQPASSPFSLIDLSRIRWSHSYSVSYFSGGNHGSSVGMLTSSMFYPISSKLSLTFNLGVVHNPGALWGNGDTQASLFPGFRLDYRPSDKVFMSLSVQQCPWYYSSYYRPGYRSLYSPLLTY